MSRPTLYATLTSTLSELDVFPGFASEIIAPVTDQMAYIDSVVLFDEDGLGSASITCYVMEEEVIELPLLPGAGLVLGGGNLTLGVGITDEDQYFFIKAETFALRFPRELLKPATDNGDGTYTVSDDETEFVDIVLPFGAEIDTSFALTVHWPGEASTAIALPLCQIADSGLLISASGIQFNFAADQIEEGELASAGLDSTFRGMLFESLAGVLPSSILDESGNRVAILGENVSIGTNGISGTFRINALPSAKLFGMGFAMNAASITLTSNTITAGSITGELTLPFFKEVDGGDLSVSVAVAFGDDGNLKVAISDDDDDGLVTLSTVLGDLTLSGIAFGTLDDGVAYLELAGSLDLAAVGGIDLPEVSVNGLRITSGGDISMASGAGIALEQQVIIDLKGFQIEIDAIGFGTESDKNFVSFSGGIKLTEALPMGVSAKGLRVLWLKDPAPIIDGDSIDDIARKLGLAVTCEGVGIEFEIPDVLSLAGSVTFDNDNERFTGKGSLNLISLDMTIDAAFIVGKAEGAGDAHYRYFGVQLETQLPFGIPLGSTGIALYGFAGLFAQNMAPLTVEGVDGFSFVTGDTKQLTFVEDSFDWYLDWYRPASGFFQPWAPEEGAFGFGVGVVFGTQADNGYTISIDKALVFAFPIIMLQGKGNILTPRTALADESKTPIFSSLILFDGNEKSILAALGMDYMLPAAGETGEGGILDAHASSEAFFDFDDSTNWHVYLGEQEKEKRIRAEVLRLFEADSYLMLENSGIRAGVSIGIDKSFDFEVVSAGLKAWLSGDAVVTWAPQYLAGNLDLDADLWLEAFGFDFSMSAHAGIAAQTPTPKELEVDLDFTLDLPWPFDPVEVDIRMRWYQENESSPISPLIKEASMRDYMTTDSWSLTLGADSLAGATGIADIVPFLSAGPGELSGGMPLDARPAVTFTRNVVDNSAVTADVPAVGLEDGGDHEYGYELESVELHKWDDTMKIWVAVPDLTGYWQETGEDAATMLELFGDGPFSFCRNNISMASGDPADAPPFWIPFTDTYLAVHAGGGGYPIDLTPTALDFENYDVGDTLGTHNLGPEFAGTPVAASVTMDGAGVKALPVRLGSDHARTPNGITVVFPEAVQLQKVKLYGLKAASAAAWAEIRGTHADGTSVSVRARFELPNASREFALPPEFANVAGIAITGQNAYLEGFTYIAQATLDAAEDLSKDAASLLDPRVCLEPDTIYRLGVVANTYVDTAIADFDPSTVETAEASYCFFRTEGPPTDLSPYVDATVPASVESPHYAGYDITLELNQTYVRSMYGNDIVVQVVDENGAAATDAVGDQVTFETAWRFRTASAVYTTKVYLGALADAGVAVPPDATVRNDVLDARIISGNALPAGKRLEARFTYPGYDTPIRTLVFTTSRYAAFTAFVDAFRTAAWRETIAAAPAASALADFSAGMDALGLGTRNLPLQPDVSALHATDVGATVALLLESPEPIEWDRVELSIPSAPGGLSRSISADGTRALLYVASGSTLAAWPQGDHTLSFRFRGTSEGLPDLRAAGSAVDESRSVVISIA